MNIFKKRRQKTRKKRQSTEEQRYRNAELKRKRYLEETLVEMAEEDPAFKRQLISQTYKIALPDPAEGERERLKTVINKLVLQRIEENPEVAKKIADAKIFQTMQEEGLITGGEDGRDRPSTVRQYITRVEEINELKEVLGIKERGFFDAFMRPEVLKSIFSFVSSVWGGKDTSNTGEAMVSVQMNGEIKEIPMSELKRLQSEGWVQKTGEEESPGHDIQNIDDDTSHELNTPDKTEGDIEPLES